MKRVFILTGIILFLGALIFAPRPESTPPKLDRAQFLGHTKDYIVAIINGHSVATTNREKPGSWSIVGEGVFTADTYLLQTSRKNNFILFPTTGGSTLVDLDQQSSQNISHPFTDILLAPHGNSLLLAEPIDHKKLKISLLTPSQKSEIITIRVQEEQEQLFIDWDGQNNVWYGYVTMYDDGGGTITPSETSTFFKLDLTTKKQTTTKKNIRTIMPSSYTDDYLFSVAEDQHINYFISKNNVVTKFATTNNGVEEMTCDFGNTTTILCEGVAYNRNPDIFIRLFSIETLQVTSEKFFNAEKILPTFFTLDQATKNLYMVNLVENGVMYKETIP